MTIAQAKAVRNRYRMRFRDQAPIGRPVYGTKSVDKQRRRLQQMIEKQKLIAARKGRSKK